MDNDRNYCVYIHRNKINGKMYVGQTIHGDNPNKRWKNGYGYIDSVLFYNAIQKYGWDNFEHIIVLNNLSLEDANYFEEILIQKLDATNRDKGYNLKNGGENHKLSNIIKEKISNKHKGKHFSNETKQKLSEALSGRHLTEEAKHKMSESRKGEKNHFHNKHHTEDAKQKMREAREGRYNGKNNHMAKSVVCLETNEIFETIRDAARKINIDSASICMCCKGKLKTAGKLHWEYYDDNKTN